jgi:hypothetical protein
MPKFQKTAENADHVFAVECVEDGNFQAVFPEPMADMSSGMATKQDAYLYLLSKALGVAASDRWAFKNPLEAFTSFCEALRFAPLNEDRTHLRERWFIYSKGTPLSLILKDVEVVCWPVNERREYAKRLWESLGDVPVDDYQQITQAYLFFVEGTSAISVWHWFEAHFDLSIANDLMYHS